MPDRLARLRGALRQILGMPDYSRYVQETRDLDPGADILSEREYYDRYLTLRYGRGWFRCC